MKSPKSMIIREWSGTIIGGLGEKGFLEKSRTGIDETRECIAM